MIGITIVCVLILAGIFAYLKYTRIMEYKLYTEEADSQINLEIQNRQNHVQELIVNTKYITDQNVLSLFNKLNILTNNFGKTHQDKLNSDIESKEILNQLNGLLDSDSNQKTKAIMTKLFEIENNLSFAFQYYEQSIIFYNNSIESSIGKGMAKLLNLKPKETIIVPEEIAQEVEVEVEEE